MNSLRSTLAAVVIATGTLASSFSPALAGDPSFGFYFGSHGGGIALGFGGHGHHGGHGGYGGPACSKFEALDKAASLGVYNRKIKSVGAKNIVVKGKIGGAKVEVVMKRKSYNCAVKDIYYI